MSGDFELYLEWKGWSAAGGFAALDAQHRRYYDAEMKRTGLSLAEPLNVLEIGFGAGHFLRYARERSWKITATELNDELVRIAQQAGFNAIPANGLASLPDNSFDLVVVFEVLEHIERDVLLGFLQELKRVLRKGGVLLARFPNGDSPFGLVNQNGDVTHRTFIGSGMVTYFATALGASVLFLGGQAQPIRSGNLKKTLYRLGAIPLRKLINFLVRLVIMPETRTEFCATNLVTVIRMD